MKYKRNFKILHKDGKRGHPTNSKNEIYDGIHVGAACEFIPFHLLNQLKNRSMITMKF